MRRLLGNGRVRARKRLGARGRGVVVSRDEGRQVAGGGVREEELLCGDGAAGVDDDGLRAGRRRRGRRRRQPPAEGRRDVWEERAGQLAVVVAAAPEVSLQGFQRRGLGVGGGEVRDVREEGGARGGVLPWEGEDVRSEWGGGR